MCCAAILKDQLFLLDDALRNQSNTSQLYLRYGTLLGAARNGRIVPYTDDNDLFTLSLTDPSLYQHIGDVIEEQSAYTYYVQVCVHVVVVCTEPHSLSSTENSGPPPPPICV